MNPQFQLMLQQAIQAFQSGNLDAAELILKKALEENLSNTDTFFELGLFFAQKNRIDEALVIFQCLQPYAINNEKIPYNIGLIYSIQGNHSDALTAYDLALKIKPDDVDTLVNKSSTLIDIKNYTSALEVLNNAIQLKFNIPEAWSNKGVALNKLKLYEEAIDSFDQALSLKPDYAEAWSNKGVALIELKRYEKAITHFDQALTLNPNSAAWSNKGAALNELERYEEALTHFDQALSLKPDYAEAWSNKGLALSKMKRYEEAITHYEKAINLKPDYAEAWSNKGAALNELERFSGALTHYDMALSLKPDYAEAWSNKGITLNELERYEEALNHFDQALNLKPDYAEAWSNKGAALNVLKRYEEAIASFDQALTLKPDYAEGWSNKGIALNELIRYEEAITHYEKALSFKSDIDYVHGELLHIKMKIGSWSNLEDSLASVFKKVIANERVIQPFSLLSLTDNALLQKKSAEVYAQDRYPINSALGPIPKAARKDKIRIGYFSADFRNHAVSYLTAELFELHNRSCFEVFAFSLQMPLIDDDMNKRLRRGFDRFIDVGNLSEQEIAQRSRELHIDIAIDLSGPTKHSRTRIFSYRVAPIQVNWLGYPGTFGAQFIDYIVADNIIIPEPHQHFYTEKVVRLPDTYMVDDSKRIASERLFTREECGLPKNAFVFCCFNNDYKFNAPVLDSWSRILLGTEKSVLWISENNARFKVNITAEFEKRGIQASRIIFAQRVELMADHLARYRLADLFLDTYPYNAHTTSVDSLKAGVPVLTLKGQSFASRVAASLLHAIGLPELITNSQEEYEALAINLTNNPDKLLALKEKLEKNRKVTPLFDTPRFAMNIEAAYSEMYERYQANLEPDHIAII